MTTFLKVAWRLGCSLLAIVYIPSCFTSFIPSAVFSYSVFFALLFPYLFLGIAAAGILNLFINKKWAAAFLFLLIIGLYNFFHTVALSPFSSWAMQKDTGTFRVMTWNVSEFLNPAPLDLPDAKERREIYHTITEYNPDILCIQEFYNADNSRDLPSEVHEIESLGYRYHIFSGDQRQKTFYGMIERGVIIFSKTPFGQTGTMQIRKDLNIERVAWGDVTIQHKALRMNTGHLVSYYLFPDSARGYVGEKKVAKKLYVYKDDVDVKLRGIEAMHEAQASNIARLLDISPHPVIYCGDMNATPVMYSYQKLKGNRQDAFLQKGTGIGATFYNIVPTLRIDAIFPDDHFTVTQCTVVHRKLGDHYPVVADLKWKER